MEEIREILEMNSSQYSKYARGLQSRYRRRIHTPDLTSGKLITITEAKKELKEVQKELQAQKSAKIKSDRQSPSFLTPGRADLDILSVIYM